MSKFNCILVGPIGTGKTSALATIKGPLYVLATEPGIDRILEHSPQTHWHYIAPANPDWSVMAKNANMVNTMTQDQLMKMAGVNRQEYRQFIEVLNTCGDFKCDVCSQSFGAVDLLPEGSTFAVDGLSGLSIMSMDLVAGGKPTKTQPDWGTAMDNIERFVSKCTGSTKCNFVLISHLDREVNELTGATQLMVSTLGRKLAPRIPRFFDEVVYCYREGSSFWWSSIQDMVDLKVRRLPFADKIKPDLMQLFD